MFVPRNEYEETILLLLISEAMAVRDAVLSQSPEFKEARIHAFENATAVYDLLTVVVVRWSQVELLHEVKTFFFFIYLSNLIFTRSLFYHKSHCYSLSLNSLLKER